MTGNTAWNTRAPVMFPTARVSRPRRAQMMLALNTSGSSVATGATRRANARYGTWKRSDRWVTNTTKARAAATITPRPSNVWVTLAHVGGECELPARRTPAGRRSLLRYSGLIASAASSCSFRSPGLTKWFRT